MNAAELDTLLKQFLEDGKLNKSERSTLTAWVQSHIATEQDRAVARSRAFEAARAALSDPHAIQVLTFLEDVLKVILPPQAASPAEHPETAVAFSPGETCLAMLLHHLNACRHSADICVFTITDDRLSDAILAAQHRGVRVRIITDNDKAEDQGSDVPRFLAAKIPLVEDRTPLHMHHKFAIFDGAHLVTGSYNWTRGAALNMENLVALTDSKLIVAFQKEFDALWANLSN